MDSSPLWRTTPSSNSSREDDYYYEEIPLLWFLFSSLSSALHQQRAAVKCCLHHSTFITFLFVRCSPAVTWVKSKELLLPRRQETPLRRRGVGNRTDPQLVHASSNILITTTSWWRCQCQWPRVSVRNASIEYIHMWCDWEYSQWIVSGWLVVANQILFIGHLATFLDLYQSATSLTIKIRVIF